MKKYLRIPTRTRWGWLFQLIGMIVFSSLQSVFGVIASLITFALMIAFVVEVIAFIIGKNKPIKEPAN